MHNELLVIDNLTKRFGGLYAIDKVSFNVNHGEIVGLIGPNGAGKTTLFNCITGLDRPEEGKVMFGREENTSLIGLAPHEILTCGIARTFQNIRIFDGMSVLENVALGTYARTKSGLWDALFKTKAASREERWSNERAFEWLEVVGLSKYADDIATSLPFGLQRRVEIARAMATDPALLLLDEPAAGLNPVEKDELLELVTNLNSQGITILLIEHDMRIVMPVSNRIVVLDYGKRIAEGLPREIQNDPRVIEAYLGTLTN